jgi:hypothetical protein
VSLAAVPGEVNNEPMSMTWDASGRLVVGGASGDDLGTGVVYLFSGVRAGTSWSLQAAPTPVAGFSQIDAVTRIGGQVWSAGDASIAGRGWTTLEQLGPRGWSDPVQLTQFQDSRPVSLSGLPSGQGWLVTWDDDQLSHVWSMCSGMPPTTAAVRSTARSAGTAGLRIGAPPGPQDGIVRTGGSPSSGPVVAPAPGSQGVPVSGPVVARLRSALAARTPAARSAATALGSPVARPVCPTAPAGAMRCLADVVSDGSAAATDLPIGYGPKEFRQAYGLPATGGAGRTVAIVAAYGDPGLAKDLAVYRRTAGLPACTVASGCLRIVNEHGGQALPAWDAHWALEQSLDVQSVSAVCPGCHLLVVQGDSPYDEDLAAANSTAAMLGASVIDNSFGQDESTSDPAYAATFVPKGVTLVAAAGDAGLDAQFPAAVPRVVGVGGTALIGNPGSARGWRETAWRDGGGGCSAIQAKPAWQRDSLCSTASTVDVSADADPASGAAVYDARGLGDGEPGGWYVVGGTSLAAPLVAGITALRDGPAGPAAYWTGSAHAYDVKGGSNGWCAPLRECTATAGYDGATGWGSPAP